MHVARGWQPSPLTEQVESALQRPTPAILRHGGRGAGDQTRISLAVLVARTRLTELRTETVWKIAEGVLDRVR